MDNSVLFEVRDNLGIITINRPERHNALDDDASARLDHVFDEALEAPDVRVILLRGAGRSFCSGRDTSVLGFRAHDESDFHFIRRHQQLRLKMLDSPKPVIAAIRGGAIGGGCELALAADIRIASDRLILALPEINFGLLPDTGGTQFLAHLIGASRAKLMIMTGKRIDAETALAWGAVDMVVPDGELDESAIALAQSVAAKPPISLAMAKMMIDQSSAGMVRNGIAQELLAQTALFRTDDYAEARAAIREQRPPIYKGR